jgi:superfamily II DNA or RNA helicase
VGREAAVTIPLRPYQEAAIAALRLAHAQGRRRVVVVLPCGAGKTLMAMTACARAVSSGRRVLWCAHRDELLRQPHRAAVAVGVDPSSIGIVKAEEDDADRPLVIASTPTLARASRRRRVLGGGLPPFALAVYDECHRAGSRTGREILAALPASCMVVGLTATPERGDGASLAREFPGGVAYSYTLLEAVRDGWLVDLRAVRVDVPELVLDSLAVGEDGDYDDRALASAMAEDAVVRATSDAWAEHCRDRRTLVFCAGVAQAEATVSELALAGARAEIVVGATPQADRDEAAGALRRGEIDCVVNVQVYGEGADMPEVDAVVVARPTLSKPCYQQMIGRGLRPAPGKGDGLLVVDLVGSSVLHSQVTAPVLVGLPEGTGGWLGERALAADPGAATREWDVSRRRRAWCHWTELPGGAVAASGPARSMAIVRPTGAGGWLCDLWTGDMRHPLAPAPVWRELAVSLGEDAIRRMEGARRLSKADAGWRDLPPTDRQVALAARLGLGTPGPTRGAYGDALTRAFAVRKLKITS